MDSPQRSTANRSLQSSLSLGARDNLWCDEQALVFLAERLLADDYDHAALTGWKSVDLLGSADPRAADFRDALVRALNHGKRVSFLIGGIFSDEDQNTLLFDLRRIFAKRDLRAHFDLGRLRFARDGAERPFHAKCWVFWKGYSVIDLLVGSFNLSAGSFFRNVEAAARAELADSTPLIETIQDTLEHGAIPPHAFAKIENLIAQRRPTIEHAPVERDLGYLQKFEHASSKPPPATRPRKRKTSAPQLVDYLVLLRDPGRSHRVGYQIPKELLTDIFGPDFLGTRETAMGIIQGPRCLIVPFRIDLAKEFRARMAALSKEITTRCTPTSVGYTVSIEKRDKLDERLERRFEANEKTKQKLIAFVDDAGFRDFVMAQINAQIEELRKRYAKQVQLSTSEIASKLAPRRDEVEGLARCAANQMIERLERERTVSYISLDKMLDLTEGISRGDIEDELARREPLRNPRRRFPFHDDENDDVDDEFE